MATKLTPETLRRIVLEEKKKLEDEVAKKHDKKALKDLKMEMDEEWPGTDSMETVKQTPGEKLKTLKMLKEAEARLLRQLRVLQERRLALRKELLSDA